MTELSGYNPDQAPQGDLNPNRLVFVPETQKHLEFDVRAAAEEQGKVVGADNPELYRALEDAHNAAQQVKEEAVQRIAEGIGDPEFAQATGWNAVAVDATRDEALINGI
jgi:hypothetical protein